MDLGVWLFASIPLLINQKYSLKVYGYDSLIMTKACFFLENPKIVEIILIKKQQAS